MRVSLMKRSWGRVDLAHEKGEYNIEEWKYAADFPPSFDVRFCSASKLRVSTVEKESLSSSLFPYARNGWRVLDTSCSNFKRYQGTVIETRDHAALNHPYNYFFLSKKFLITFISSPLIFLYRMHKRMVEN